jgi:hypothetical protein
MEAAWTSEMFLYYNTTRRHNPEELDFNLCFLFTLKMDAVWTSETFASYRNTKRCYSPEELDLNVFSFRPEDGGSMNLRNFGILLQH